MPPSYAGLKKLKENIHEKRERHFMNTCQNDRDRNESRYQY